MKNTVDGLQRTKPTLTTNRGIERAGAIMHAARDTLAASGFAGLSMRAVAARVGISLGNLQYYFASKEELIEALLGYMQDDYQRMIETVLEAHASRTPLERFQLAIEFLWGRVQDPPTATIFLEIWALSSREEFAGELVRKVRAREHKAMLLLLRKLPELESATDLEQRASMIVLIMEGLLVQLACPGMPKVSRAALAEAAKQSVMRLALEKP